MKDTTIIVTTYVSPVGDGFDREEEYRRTLSQLQEMMDPEDVVIIEALGNRGTFLEEYGFPVHYAGIPNEYKNKGCNEAAMLLTVKKKIERPRVVKLTGRYFPKDRSFFDLVDTQPSRDIVCRLSSGKLWTGCFGSSTDLFFESLSGLDLDAMEREWKCLEDEWWSFYADRTKLIIDNVKVSARIGENKYVSEM